MEKLIDVFIDKLNDQIEENEIGELKIDLQKQAEECAKYTKDICIRFSAWLPDRHPVIVDKFWSNAKSDYVDVHEIFNEYLKTL